MVKWCYSLPVLGAVFLFYSISAFGSPKMSNNIDALASISDLLQIEIDRLTKENAILRGERVMSSSADISLPAWFEASRNEANFISVTKYIFYTHHNVCLYDRPSCTFIIIRNFMFGNGKTLHGALRLREDGSVQITCTRPGLAFGYLITTYSVLNRQILFLTQR